MNKSASHPLTRSPLLMSRQDTALLIVDMQPKLLNLIESGPTIVWNNRRLLDGAKLFDVPVMGTEQYPHGLGGTEPSLAERMPSPAAKVAFSCGACTQLFENLAADGRHKILVVGIETHVCIQQTVLDLLTACFEVYVAVDAVGARNDIDHRTALARMELAGATLTTTESALFEFCEEAGTDRFKAMSQLIQEPPPQR
jgi:nicotinamidase-related amidase